MKELIIKCVIYLGLALCGFLIRKKQCYWLIAGYNTASPEEKAQVPIEKLANLLGLFLYCIAAFGIAISLVSHFCVSSPSIELLLNAVNVFAILTFCEILVVKFNQETYRIAIIVVSVLINILVLASFVFKYFKIR